MLQPLGSARILETWLADEGSYWSLEDFIGSTPVELPLLEEINQKRSRRPHL